MDSVWGQRFIEVPTEEEKVKYLKNTIGTIQPGQGLTQWLNMFEGTGLNPNSTPQQFLDAVTKVGNGDLDKGIGALTEQGGIFRNPDVAKQVLEQIKNNPDGYKSLGEMFKGDWAGTGRSIGDTLVTVPGGSVVETIAKKVTVPILKKVLIKTAAGSAAPIVGALGIGLIAAGALVKGMRIKGQKQSRAKTLNDLYQSLVDLKPTQENPSSGIIKTDGKGGDKQNQQGGTTGINIECVKNLIKATIQLNEMINKGVVKIPTKPTKTSPQPTQPNKPQPTQQKQGRFPNSKPLTQSQLKSSIDAVVHNLLREFIELKEAGAAWNTANAANVTQTNAPKGGALQAGETDAVNSWNKVVKAFKQANVSALVKPMELLVNTSISQGKDTLKAAQEDMMQIGNLIIQNRATIGKVIPFEQLVKEAEDPKIARSRNVQAIAKAISLVSRIIMAYKEDVGLTGAYGSAKAPMNLFIQAYDCVVKGGGKSGGQTTQGTNPQVNNRGGNQQGSNQSNQGGGNQPEGDETEQSVSQETSNKKPTGVGFDTKVSGSIRGDYFR
jgi:hypothetical protein